MGQKGSSSPQTTTSSSSPPPQVLAEYQGLVDRATNVANQPYQAYQGEQVAPLSNQTIQGLGGISQYANAAQPGYAAAMAGTAAAATPVSPTQYSGQALGQFMNPYTQSVVNATQNQFANQNMQQAQALNSNAIGAGAYGGDRAGVAQSILANQQQTAQAPVIAGLNQANFTNAQNEFNTQQQTGLQAQEYNAGQLGAMANQYGALAGQAQQAGLQGSQANLQAGMIPQQEQQAIDTAMQNNYLQQQAYPFQTTGWLGNLIEGTGSASGGTGTQSSPGPSTTSQALGGITSGLGILGSLFSLSDARVKDDIRPIGKTFDGQTIYRFRFKGDPRTQIGLLAHEAEKKHPDSVGEGLGGLKHIDYGDATSDAADRGRFSYGGMIRPGYADGGQQPIGQGGAAGMATPGFNPLTDQLSPLAGVNEALFGAESAGSKNPYVGVDFDQIQAISGGQWMPPVTNSPLPDYQHPGSSPQTAGAEASLAGLIARPGIETNMGGSGSTPSTPQQTMSQPAATADPIRLATTSEGMPAGETNLGRGVVAGTPTPFFFPSAGRGNAINSAISQEPGLPAGASVGTGNPLWASMMRARGGRAGFASGGGPDFTTVQLNPNQRNAPIYTALDLSGGKKSDPVPTPAPPPEHPAVTIARHIARQRANAPANNNRAPAPVAKTGTDPPDHPSTMRYPMWPTPPVGTSGSGGPLDPDPFPGPITRFGAKIPPDFLPRRPGTAPTEPDPLGWGVGENPTPPSPSTIEGLPPPESPGAFFGRLPGRLLGATPFGRAAGIGRGLLQSSPAETGELPPAYWPRDAAGAPNRPVTATPRVIPLPNQSSGRPPISLFGPSGPIDLGTWEGEGGAGPRELPEPTPRDPTAEMGWGDEGPVNYARGGRLMRAAGGILGQSGMGAALDQPPQGSMFSGASSSGGAPQGGFATAAQAAGFDQLYGSGRSGFASGGDASTLAPYQGGEGFQSWVPTAANAMMGKGPPQAPSPQPQPQASSAQQGQDLSKAIEKIGPMLKSKLSGPAPIAMPGSDGANVDLSGAAGTPDFSNLSGGAFDLGGGADLGGGFDNFARGGRLARAAGGAPTPTDSEIEAAFPDDPAPAPTTALGAIAAGAGPPQGDVGRGLSTNRAETSPAQRAEFYRQYIASKYPGADPSIALGVAQAEGLNTKGVGASTVDIDPRTGQPFSFGDFQMNIHPGALGDQARKAGYDPTDPNQWQGVGKFAIDQMYGSGKPNLGPWQGDAYAKAYLAGHAPSSGVSAYSESPSGGGGADGLPGPMTVPQGYFQPRDYADPNSSKRELFGAMMAAGFGMMAGTSPYAAVNIGQGGLAGVNYLQKQQELDHDWMLNQAKIDQMSSQERRADADIGLRVNQWNLELAKYKGMMATNANVANILSGGSSSGGSGGGSPAAPTASPPPADTPGATGPHGVAPSNLGDVGLGDTLISAGINPSPSSASAAPTPAFGGPGSATPKIAPGGAPAPIVAPGPSGPAGGAPSSASAKPNAPSAQAQPVASPAPPASAAAAPAAATAPTGVPPENDPFWQGKPNPYRLLKAGQALMASPDPAQQTRGQELMRQGQEIFKSIGETGMAGGAFVPGVLEQKNMIEAQKPIYQKFQEDKQKFAQNYDITRGQLGELSHIYANFQAGRSSEAQAELASWANAAGFKLDQAAGFDSAMKSAMLQAFDQVNASGLQKAPRASLREAILTVASPTKDPAALRKIMADSMATLDYNHDLYNSVNSYDTTKGVTSFADSHKYEDYVKKARGEIPMFKGITPETLKNTTGEDWPAPPMPSGLPSGTKYSPSTQKWWDPSGKSYNPDGTPG